MTAAERNEINRKVRLVYHQIHKSTGNLGGWADGGSIYGELTESSMQKMVNLMKDFTDFGPSSRFIDVGSGIGKPNLHVIQDPGVEFSYGIEMQHIRWMLSLASLDAVLQEAGRTNSTLGYKCMFDRGDIQSATTFDPFTHVYMFSIGFPPKLWKHLASMFNASQSPYLICFHSPQDIIDMYGFEVQFVAKTTTSLHGSGEAHSGYIYRRISREEPHNAVECDAVYRDAYELVQSGRERLSEFVSNLLNQELNGGRVTRRN